MDNSRVSLVIATYNRCGFLSRLLDELNEQTLLPSEIIIVDNNSSDRTREIVNGYLSKAPLKYIFEQQRGVSFARNAGIRSAVYEIIVFIDDDCLPAGKEWLENLVKNFDLDPRIGIIGGNTIPFPSGLPKWLKLFCDNLTRTNSGVENDF